MGLLDQFFGAQDGGDPDQKAASQQGLLALGLGLLGSKGSFSSALGNSGMQAMQTYQGAQDSALNRKLKKSQIDENAGQAILRQQQAQREMQKQQWLQENFGAGGQAQQPGQMPAGAPQTPPMGQGMPQAPTVPAGSQGMPPGNQGTAGQQPQSDPAAIAAAMPPQVKSHLAAMTADQIAAGVAQGVIPKELVEVWKLAKFGQQMQPGYRQNVDGTTDYLGDPTKGVTMGPGGQVSQMPGAAQSLAGIAGAQTGAQEAAKAPYTLVDGYDPNTRAPVKMPLSQVLGMSAPQQGSPQQPPEFQSNNPASMRLQLMKIPDPAQRAQVLAAFDQKYPQATAGFQTGPSVADKASATAGDDINKNWVTSSYTPTLKAGDDANSMIANIRSARTGLAGVGSTGWGTETRLGAQNVLAALGVPEANKQVASAQMFQSAAAGRLLDVLKAQTGVQTEGDSQRAAQTFAKLGNRPEANQFILDMAEAVAQRDAKKAAWYRDAVPLGKAAGDLQMIDRKWQERAPSIWSMPSLQKWAK